MDMKISFRGGLRSDVQLGRELTIEASLRSYADVEAAAESLFFFAAEMWPEEAAVRQDVRADETGDQFPVSAPSQQEEAFAAPPFCAPSAKVLKRQSDSADDLSEFQRKVLPLAREGLSAAAIAERLGANVHGVRAVIGKLRAKGLVDK